jgi:hypothetical protein
MRSLAAAALLLFLIPIPALAQASPSGRELITWDTRMVPSMKGCMAFLEFADSVELHLGISALSGEALMSVSSEHLTGLEPGKRYVTTLQVGSSFARRHVADSAVPRQPQPTLVWIGLDRDFLYDLARSNSLTIKVGEGKALNLKLPPMESVLDGRFACDKAYGVPDRFRATPPTAKASVGPLLESSDDKWKTVGTWEIGIREYTRNQGHCFATRRDASGVFVRIVRDDMDVLVIGDSTWTWLEKDDAAYQLVFHFQPGNHKIAAIAAGSRPPSAQREPQLFFSDPSTKDAIDRIAQGGGVVIKRRDRDITAINSDGMPAALRELEECGKALKAKQKR